MAYRSILLLGKYVDKKLRHKNIGFFLRIVSPQIIKNLSKYQSLLTSRPNIAATGGKESNLPAELDHER